MARKPVNESLDKWQKNTADSTGAYERGVDRVTVSPTAKAADAAPKYAAGVQRAVDDGRYAAGCRAVTLGDWQTAAKQKGKANLATGVRNLSARAKKNITEQLVYAQSVADQIASMPNESESDAKARMDRNYDLMKARKKNG